MEMRTWFAPLGTNVLGLSNFPSLPEIVEDGSTFAENALKKAKIIAEHLQMPVLADDSGLCVDLLDGRPGIYSARYAGEHATDEANNKKLLNELNALRASMVDDAQQDDCLSEAQFKCALALYIPQGQHIFQVEGECEGYITAIPRGTQGFGYDPLFVIPALKRTMAELPPHVKNQISHRAQALRKLMAELDI